MSNEQTPDKTNVEAQPSTEVKVAEDNLVNLLSEYETGVQPKTETEVAEPDVKMLAAELQSIKRERAENEYRHDMGSFVKSVRGELDPEVFDDDLVEGFVEAYAKKNPAFIKAWIDRKTNPAKFEKIGKAMSKEFSKKFEKLIDKNITDNVEAIAAAVRGSKITKAEPDTVSEKDYKDMSDRDFYKLQNSVIYGR